MHTCGAPAPLYVMCMGDDKIRTHTQFTVVFLRFCYRFAGIFVLFMLSTKKGFANWSRVLRLKMKLNTPSETF